MSVLSSLWTVNALTPLTVREGSGDPVPAAVAGGVAYTPAVGDRVLVAFVSGRFYIVGTPHPTVPDDSGWIELTGWLNGTTAYQAGLGGAWTPRYRKINGIVYLAGLFNSGATTTPLHVNTLPVGYRPGTGTTMLAIPHTGTGVRRLDIAANGVMTLREQFAGAATTGWHSLQNSFPAEN